MSVPWVRPTFGEKGARQAIGGGGEGSNDFEERGGGHGREGGNIEATDSGEGDGKTEVEGMEVAEGRPGQCVVRSGEGNCAAYGKSVLWHCGARKARARVRFSFSLLQQ